MKYLIIVTIAILAMILTNKRPPAPKIMCFKHGRIWYQGDPKLMDEPRLGLHCVEIDYVE